MVKSIADYPAPISVTHPHNNKPAFQIQTYLPAHKKKITIKKTLH